MDVPAFKGTTDQYERLRAAVRKLSSDGVNSNGLLHRAERFFKECAKDDPRSPKYSLPSYTNLNKFKSNGVTKIGGAEGLWVFFYKSDYKTYIDDIIHPEEEESEVDHLFFDEEGSEVDHHFFYSLTKFFDVHKHRESRVLKFTSGRFRLFHYSEMFYNHSKSIDKAIVVAQLDIKPNSSGVITVREEQHYDGRLGPRKRDEVSLGYCLPKSLTLCMILKDSHDELPKFYIFSQKYHDPISGRTEWMRGYMLKASDSDSSLLHFYSPIYAIRVGDDEEVQCNILQCSEIDANILSELNKGQVVMYEKD